MHGHHHMCLVDENNSNLTKHVCSFNNLYLSCWHICNDVISQSKRTSWNHFWIKNPKIMDMANVQIHFSTILFSIRSVTHI